MESPVLGFQSSMVLSSPPVASKLPSREKATDPTEQHTEGSVSVLMESPVLGFQRQVVVSPGVQLLPEASKLPSGEKATELTPIASLGPVSVCTNSPAESQHAL